MAVIPARPPTPFVVPPAQAETPFVIALDVGSTATRGGLYDRQGRPVGNIKHKVPHSFTTDADGTSIIDPDQVTFELAHVIDMITNLATYEGIKKIAAVGIDTFAASLVGVGVEGHAITPCYTYADTRCAPDVQNLRQEYAQEDIHKRTGTRLHASYLPARLRWLQRTGPNTFSQVTRWLSLGEYAHEQLLGASATAQSTASWTGLVNVRTGLWDPQMLNIAGIKEEQLGTIDPYSHAIEPLHAGQIKKRWKPLKNALWFPAITDGYAATIGTGIMDDTQLGLSTSTSGAMRVLLNQVPADIPWACWAYRVNDRQCLLGGALNDVGRAFTWMETNLQLPLDPGERDQILCETPSGKTPLSLPFFSGERSTLWNSQARAAFTGIGASSGAPALFRGMAEGVALTYARLSAIIRTVSPQLTRVRAAGSVIQKYPGLVQLLSDAIKAPIVPVTIKRATAHGTALSALEGIDPGGQRAEVTMGDLSEPDLENHAHYRKRLEEFEALHESLLNNVTR
ncbi:MAG: FGGY family carbohydrate kinase [Actinomycetaceae bacterium]|nr:FGGY family carbohydrate kinase [Actinomycetaceae bacterium]